MYSSTVSVCAPGYVRTWNWPFSFYSFYFHTRTFYYQILTLVEKQIWKYWILQLILLMMVDFSLWMCGYLWYVWCLNDGESLLHLTHFLGSGDQRCSISIPKWIQEQASWWETLQDGEEEILIYERLRVCNSLLPNRPSCVLHFSKWHCAYNRMHCPLAVSPLSLFRDVKLWRGEVCKRWISA